MSDLMSDLFGVSNSSANYGERIVDNFQSGDLIVDTTQVYEGIHPYETAVIHPKYQPDKWIIVEAYDTKEASQEGHNRWVKTMTADELPTALVDCANTVLSQFGISIGMALIFPRKD